MLRESASGPASGSSAALRSEGGADVYSLRFVAPFDEDAFLEAASPYARVIVLEDGVLRGGIGERLVSLVATRLPRVVASAAGFPSKPYPQATRDQLLERAGLDPAGIAARVRAAEVSDTGKRIFVYRAAEEEA